MVRMPAIDPVVTWLAAVALAGIFGWSAALKLTDIEMFAGALANYRLVPRALETPFAWVVPLCESAAAAGLLLPRTRPIAAVGLVLLLCLFSGAIAINLIRGRTNIDCGCFGPALRQDLSGWLLVRNAGLMVLAAILVAPMAARPIEWIDFVTIGLGAATLVTLYAGANQANGNAPRTGELEAL